MKPQPTRAQSSLAQNAATEPAAGRTHGRAARPRGRFRPAFSKDGRLSSVAIEAAELALIVEGIELAGARRRPRWQPAALPAKKKVARLGN